MTQITSKLAYDGIKRSLGDKQLAVLDVIKTHEHITNNEIAERLRWSINRVTPRVYELREMGYVKEWGKRYDKETGRLAIAWQEARDTLF